MTLIFISAILCSSPEVVNWTSSWNEIDKMSLESATNRCSQIYKEEAPCLKLFFKTDENSYRAICGRN